MLEAIGKKRKVLSQIKLLTKNLSVTGFEFKERLPPAVKTAIKKKNIVVIQTTCKKLK